MSKNIVIEESEGPLVRKYGNAITVSLWVIALGSHLMLAWHLLNRFAQEEEAKLETKNNV